ncbi:putative proteinase inhibitor I3, Kunitz legume [Medicago truncatula]|uniref:Kunitz type trypsin inhibitor / Alpha-fucosidase n=1 Tax=Medicago truncatula TaxID=3880 RepID=A0A396HKF1_MEDTR|nr:putative proteinase inhibitor I3, Kunitz legume [Medicago truncatula]
MLILSSRIYMGTPFGGGFRLGETENSTCPFTVLQDYSNLGHGLPVKLTPQNQPSSDDPITRGLHLDIAFDYKPDCAESSKWLMVEAENEFPTPWLAIDGTGKNVHDGWFELTRYKRSGYLIFFCYKNDGCIYLSRKNDKNGMRLVYETDGDGDALGAVFVKDDDAARARISSVV